MPLSNSPTHVAQAALSVPLGTSKAYASMTVRAISARTAKDGSRVPGYLVPALTIWAPSIGRHLSARLVLDNVFDREYGDPAADELRQVVVPQDGRTLFVGVSWRFR